MNTIVKITHVTIWLAILVMAFAVSAPFILVEWLFGSREGGYF